LNVPAFGTSRFSTFLARGHGWDLLATAVGFVALRMALATVSGLESPFDGDHFRDIAQAQTALDGHPLSDPVYAGEWVWYNPFLPWVVAVGASLTGLTPAVFHVAGGPWLNLAGPVVFYILSAKLAGRPAAVVATVFFLFWTSGNEPTWASATYTPWLFTADFAQALFYACCLVAVSLHDRVTWPRTAAAGLLLGLTFLTHTAPFVVAAVVLATVLLGLLLQRRLTTGHVVLTTVLVLLVASPFLWSIGVHYQFDVKNQAPMTWQYEPVTWNGLPRLAKAQNWWIAALAVVGLIDVSRKWTSRFVVWPWLGAALTLTAYGLVRDLHPTWPSILPTFHFWFYLTALESLLAGAGAWAAARIVCWNRPTLAAALATAAVVVLSVSRFPAYSTRYDLQQLRQHAVSRDPSFGKAMAFLRESAGTRDVVLGTHGAGQLIIGPAGRKTVSVSPWFSNPYVAYEPRARDRDEMFARLTRGDDQGFLALAASYRVSMVMGVGPEQCASMDPRTDILEKSFVSGPVCVFRVRWSR